MRGSWRMAMGMYGCIIASGEPILGKPRGNCKSFLAAVYRLGSLCDTGKTLVGGLEIC
jgi:hypothetical protein